MTRNFKLSGLVSNLWGGQSVRNTFYYLPIHSQLCVCNDISQMCGLGGRRRVYFLGPWKLEIASQIHGRMEGSVQLVDWIMLMLSFSWTEFLAWCPPELSAQGLLSLLSVSRVQCSSRAIYVANSDTIDVQKIVYKIFFFDHNIMKLEIRKKLQNS